MSAWPAAKAKRVLSALFSLGWQVKRHFAALKDL